MKSCQPASELLMPNLIDLSMTQTRFTVLETQTHTFPWGGSILVLEFALPKISKCHHFSRGRYFLPGICTLRMYDLPCQKSRKCEIIIFLHTRFNWKICQKLMFSVLLLKNYFQSHAKRNRKLIDQSNSHKMALLTSETNRPCTFDKDTKWRILLNPRHTATYQLLQLDS